MNTLVMWDKPKQVISKEEWKNISADSAPPGVYSSNMSKKDAATWKGKVVGGKLGRPQIELRKVFSGSFKQLSDEGWGKGFCANVVIIVANKGFKYKNIKRDESVDYNIHFAMNGGAAMTFAEMEEIQLVIEEAKAKLVEVAIVSGKKIKKTRKK